MPEDEKQKYKLEWDYIFTNSKLLAVQEFFLARDSLQSKTSIVVLKIWLTVMVSKTNVWDLKAYIWDSSQKYKQCERDGRKWCYLQPYNLIVTVTLYVISGQQNYKSYHWTTAAKQQASTDKDLLNKNI